jgi:hypothetical protein
MSVPQVRSCICNVVPRAQELRRRAGYPISAWLRSRGCICIFHRIRPAATTRASSPKGHVPNCDRLDGDTAFGSRGRAVIHDSVANSAATPRALSDTLYAIDSAVRPRLPIPGIELLYSSPGIIVLWRPCMVHLNGLNSRDLVRLPENVLVHAMPRFRLPPWGHALRLTTLSAT